MTPQLTSKRPAVGGIRSALQHSLTAILIGCACGVARTQEIEVVARCLAASSVPDPSAADYADCLTYAQFRIERVIRGQSRRGETVIGVFWCMKARKLLPASKVRIGSRIRAKFEPYARRSDELDEVMRTNDLDDFDSPLLFAVEWKALGDSKATSEVKPLRAKPTDTVQRILDVLAAHGGTPIGTTDELDGRIRFTRYDYLYRDQPWRAPDESFDGPIHAIVDFRNQLSARGIELLMVFPPRASAVYPDLATRIEYDPERDGRVDRQFLAFLAELESSDVRCVDLVPLFHARRSCSWNERRFTAYLLTDPHWAPWAAAAAARLVASEIRGLPALADHPWDRITSRSERIVGVLPKRYFPDHPPREFERDALYDQLVNGAGTDKLIQRRNPASSIVLIGDSFSNVHRPRRSDFPSHLAAALGVPLHVIAQGGGGPTMTRRKLAREGLGRNVKLVVWQVVASEIARPEKWHRVELPD